MKNYKRTMRYRERGALYATPIMERSRARTRGTEGGESSRV